MKRLYELYPNYAIQRAAENGHLEVVKLLLSCPGVDPAANHSHALQAAAGHGHIEIVMLLLTCPGVDPAANNSYALQWAARNGHIEIVKLLLTCPGVDPTADNNYAIQMAAENGHLEVVKLLLSCPGVDPAAKDSCALRWATRNGHIEIVKLLLTCPGVNPAAVDNYDIKAAAKNRHIETVKLLLTCPVDPTAANSTKTVIEILSYIRGIEDVIKEFNIDRTIFEKKSFSVGKLVLELHSKWCSQEIYSLLFPRVLQDSKFEYHLVVLDIIKTILSFLPPTITAVSMRGCLRQNIAFFNQKWDGKILAFCAILNSIPNTVTSVNFQFNELFKNSTLAEIDEFLSYINKHKRYTGQINLDDNNGEQDFTRAICPMLSSVKQNFPFPRELTYKILGFLKPDVPDIQKFINSKLAEIVTRKASFLDTSLIEERYKKNGRGFFDFFRMMQLKASSDEEQIKRLREWHRENQDEAAGDSLKYFCLT